MNTLKNLINWHLLCIMITLLLATTEIHAATCGTVKGLLNQTSREFREAVADDTLEGPEKVARINTALDNLGNVSAELRTGTGDKTLDYALADSIDELIPYLQEAHLEIDSPNTRPFLTQFLEQYAIGMETVLGFEEGATQRVGGFAESGQQALRAHNSLGGLFELIGDTEIEQILNDEPWKTLGPITSPNQAFARNAMRVQLIARDAISEGRVVPAQKAFAASVYYDAESGVTHFNSFETNAEAFSGPSAFDLFTTPDPSEFYQKIDNAQFRISDAGLYADWLESNLYNQTQYGMHATIKEKIISAVQTAIDEKGGVFSQQQGLIGAHAEVVTVSEMLGEFNLEGDNFRNTLGVHTVQLIEENRGIPYLCGFFCCQYCTAILKPWVTSTSGGGTIPNGFR